jgi:hypothetical protein
MNLKRKMGNRKGHSKMAFDEFLIYFDIYSNKLENVFNISILICFD